MILGEPFFIANMVAQVSASEVVHCQIEVDFVLKSTLHVDEEGVFEFTQDSTFVENRFDVVFLKHSKFSKLYLRFDISFMAQSLMSSLL